MNDLLLREQLVSLLRKGLSQEVAEEVTLQLEVAGKVPQVLELFRELQESSAKLAGVSIEALPDVLGRCDAHTVVPWLDLAIVLANVSGAVTLKYFKESPQILGIFETSKHRHLSLIHI